MDVDTAVMPGGHELDDGLALIQAFRSPELAVRGVSAVFGNAPLEKTYSITWEIVDRFGPPELTVFPGAASGEDLGRETPASRALARALGEEKLTVLALGPVTNLATVVKNHPEIERRIEAVVAVAGRRPGQRFGLGRGGKPLRDLNFELDPEGFRLLLDSGIPLALAPFEIGSRVSLTDADIERFASGSEASRYFVPAARDWIDWYEKRFGIRSFYPWDTLAVGYLTSPELMECDQLPVEIQVHENDVTASGEKPYLIVSKSLPSARKITYCHVPNERFKEHLMARLLGR
jgi:pyrimidine-specific ribonucleoside hydrolase